MKTDQQKLKEAFQYIKKAHAILTEQAKSDRRLNEYVTKLTKVGNDINFLFIN